MNIIGFIFWYLQLGSGISKKLIALIKKTSIGKDLEDIILDVPNKASTIIWLIPQLIITTLWMIGIFLLLKGFIINGILFIFSTKFLTMAWTPYFYNLLKPYYVEDQVEWFLKLDAKYMIAYKNYISFQKSNLYKSSALTYKNMILSLNKKKK